MRYSALLLALARVISQGHAYLTGIAVPSMIAPNSTIPITLISATSTHLVADISVAIALAPELYPGALGADLLGSYYLGPEKSNSTTNITLDVHLPAGIVEGGYLTAIVTSLLGPHHRVLTIRYNVPITIGEETSEELISHTSTSDICSSSSSSSFSPAKQFLRRDSSLSCFPTFTNSLIQITLTQATALIASIDHDDTFAGLQNLGQLNGYFGDLERAIVPICSETSIPSWPRLSDADSKIRVIEMLRQMQEGLNVVQGDVLACDVEGAREVLCQVLRIGEGVGGYYERVDLE